MDRHTVGRAAGTVRDHVNRVRHRFGDETLVRQCGDLTAIFDVRKYEDYRFVTYLNEEPLIRKFDARTSENDVVWDVGGHIGLWTCLLADGLPNGSIVVFEPHPENAAALRRNITLNGYQNASVEEVALTAKPEEQDIKEDSDSSTYTLTDGGTTTVSTTTGDEITKRIGTPTAMKIDIEGAELEAIDGMENALSDCDFLMCEVHPMHGVEVVEVVSRLKSHGFTIEQDEHRGRPILWADRTDR
jgi:FkbM family methyltransferase